MTMRRGSFGRRRLAGSALLLAVPVVTACSSGAQGPHTTSPEPTRTFAKLGAADLQSRWWTWAASAVGDRNPVADKDGSHCGENQKADVFFLAGTFGGAVRRTCDLPDSVPVAFPLVNFLGTAADCADLMSGAVGSGVVDGKPVTPDRYQATPVSVTAVAGNPVTESGGTMTGRACGLWVELPPFTPGDHTVAIRGKSGGLTVSVDYTLHVHPAST